MNWVGFNNARDFTLPGKAGEPLPYLMDPHAEFGDTRWMAVTRPISNSG